MDDIREQIAEAYHRWRKSPVVKGADFGLDLADYILNIKCSRGGGDCHCVVWGMEGQMPTSYRPFTCPTCKGTGQKPIETKEIKEIIEEWENEKRS